MSLNYKDLIKSSAQEAASFAKKNAPKYNVATDLLAAKNLCKTKEARAMIEARMSPLQKELQKERAAFEKRLSGIWKAAKGEKVPKETQKELDGFLKKSADGIRAKSGSRYKLDNLFITSYSL
ncbi:MAG: hypothetical protein ABJ263_11870 [Tateyamaria sp.]|uniref:hypothetical protein n=1 Tax=Tateyamaria sp. TaxID=1929288 RepID=UPI00326AF213